MIIRNIYAVYNIDDCDFQPKYSLDPIVIITGEDLRARGVADFGRPAIAVGKAEGRHLSPYVKSGDGPFDFFFPHPPPQKRKKAI